MFTVNELMIEEERGGSTVDHSCGVGTLETILDVNSNAKVAGERVYFADRANFT